MNNGVIVGDDGNPVVVVTVHCRDLIKLRVMWNNTQIKTQDRQSIL